MARTHTVETQAPGATAAPFTITTLQQAMRAAWVGAYRGLASQGWRVAKEGPNCAWRAGPADDLRCCAVGWLLPEAPEVYDFRFSGHLSLVAHRAHLLAPALRPWVACVDFAVVLGVLQEAHDHAKDGDDLRERIEEVGRRFNLGPLPTLPPGCAS